MSTCIPGALIRVTEAGWCSVFHQSTENFTMGMFTTPTSARIAPARDPRSASSKARTSAAWPSHRKNSTSTLVSRASQTHQVPHIGLPHRLPVARQSAVTAAPTGDNSRAVRSASGCRQISDMIDRIASPV